MSDQKNLFDVDEFARWRDEWQGMPEFVQEDLTPIKSLLVHFASYDDMRAFAETVGQKVTCDTRCIWYPEAEIGRYANKRYKSES